MAKLLTVLFVAGGLINLGAWINASLHGQPDASAYLWSVLENVVVIAAVWVVAVDERSKRRAAPGQGGQ